MLCIGKPYEQVDQVRKMTFVAMRLFFENQHQQAGQFFEHSGAFSSSRDTYHFKILNYLNKSISKLSKPVYLPFTSTAQPF